MTPAEAVFAFVRTVPSGAVVSYGQVADLVEGVHVSARDVGRIMYGSPEGVPWQRVVGSDGALPIARRSPELAARQRGLLELEGVGFKPDGRIDMGRFQWHPEGLGGLFED